MGLVGPHRRLWPEDAPEEVGAARFAVVGNEAKTQVLVPVGNRRAAAESFIRHHAAMGAVERSARRAAWLATRAGLLELLARQRRRVSVTGLDEIIRQATGAKEFELSVSFGPGRANQKPVFRVMDRDGRTIAFAKLGWDDLTRSLVEREYESLNRSSVRALTRVVTPTPLHIDDWQDHRVAVFDAVPGRSGQVRPHLETFLEVARCWPGETSRLGESRYASTLWSSADRVEGPSGALARTTVSALLEMFGDEEMEFGGWHGDWTPWNNARFDPDRIVLWDWERSGQPAPLGFDAIHYRFQALVHGPSGSLRRLLDESTVNLRATDQKQLLGYLYAATISLRHLQPDTFGGPRAMSAAHLAEVREMISLRG